MSKVGAEGRSFRSIRPSDLARLAGIARQDREAFFDAHPAWAKYYADRLLCVALCQGAAKHYVDGETGINDFDVYSFYKMHPSRTWYAKRIKSYDYGDPRFGKSVDRPDFVGRRVDCLGRGIEVRPNENPLSALERYLKEGKTATARLLSAKAVVLLEPDRGQVVWPR